MISKNKTQAGLNLDHPVTVKSNCQKKKKKNLNIDLQYLSFPAGYKQTLTAFSM